MSVLINKSTRLLVQGLTGREGTFHAKQAAAYGTTVVGGVTPGKGGTTQEGWPLFGTGAHGGELRHAERGWAELEHRRAGRREGRRERDDHLRAAAVCRRRDHGGR